MRRMWTEAEEKYMERYYLFQPVQKTAKKLDRTVTAIYKKANKMKLSRNRDSLNIKILAECFSCKRKVIMKWIQKYDLPCKKVAVDNQVRYLIKTKDFWNWAEEHKDIINWNKYERLSLCPEPSWLKPEIANCHTPLKENQFYSPEEIKTIKEMLKNGKSFEQIAKKMRRSKEAIKALYERRYLEFR